MEIKSGDEIVTKSPFWHQGRDIGDCLGKVISIDSYILVEIYDYDNNPVKCFRNEIEKIVDRDEYGFDLQE